MARTYPKGIRRLDQGWQVFARVEGRYKSRRLPLKTTLPMLVAERERLRAEVLYGVPATHDTGGKTFADEAAEYLTLIAHMASAEDRRYEIERWAEAFGARPRSTLTGRDIRAVLEQWRVSGRADGTGGLSVASLNRRRTSLMSMYTALDGRASANPVKDVPEYDERDNEQIRSLPPRLAYRLIARVGRSKWGKGQKTRVRLRLMLWTGWPQKQIAQLAPGDIDWQAQAVRVTRRRKGKGAKARWLPLVHPGALAALKAFAGAEAWGSFSTSAMHSAFARAVAEENAWRRRCDPPKSLVEAHPYMLRHTFATELAKRITDERAIQELMLHASATQTRRYSEAATAGRLEMARASLSRLKL